MAFKLKHDIVIPAGTVFDTAPTKIQRHLPYIDHILPLGADSVIYVSTAVERSDAAFKDTFEEI